LAKRQLWDHETTSHAALAIPAFSEAEAGILLAAKWLPANVRCWPLATGLDVGSLVAIEIEADIRSGKHRKCLCRRRLIVSQSFFLLRIRP
jgi:hypothetical protein